MGDTTTPCAISASAADSPTSQLADEVSLPQVFARQHVVERVQVAAKPVRQAQLLPKIGIRLFLCAQPRAVKLNHVFTPPHG